MSDSTPVPDAGSGAPSGGAASAAADFEQRLRTVRTIVGALMGGVALFALVVTVLGAPLTPGLLTTPMLVGVFVAVVVVQLAVAPLVGSRVREAGGAGFMAYQTGVVVAAAVREGSGILGVMLAFLSGPTIWAVAFATVTVATLALGWPRRDEAARAWRGDPSGGP